MHIDLRGGQADTGRLIHGLQHVGDPLLECRIEHLDRLGAGAQPGIREFEYGQYSH
jgi:hypothetical protein